MPGSRTSASKLARRRRPAGRAANRVMSLRFAPACSAPKLELWPNWRYHCGLSPTDDDLEHRCAAGHLPPLLPRHRGTRHQSASKRATGLSRCPSGRFFANDAVIGSQSLHACSARRTLARVGPHSPRRAPHPTRPTHRSASRRIRGDPRASRHRAGSRSSSKHSRSAIRGLRLPLNWPWANTFDHRNCGRIRNLPTSHPSEPPGPAPGA